MLRLPAHQSLESREVPQNDGVLLPFEIAAFLHEAVAHAVIILARLYDEQGTKQVRFWREEVSSLVEAGGTVFDAPISTETEVSVTPS